MGRARRSSRPSVPPYVGKPRAIAPRRTRRRPHGPGPVAESPTARSRHMPRHQRATGSRAGIARAPGPPGTASEARPACPTHAAVGSRLSAKPRPGAVDGRRHTGRQHTRSRPAHGRDSRPQRVKRSRVASNRRSSSPALRTGPTCWSTTPRSRKEDTAGKPGTLLSVFNCSIVACANCQATPPCAKPPQCTPPNPHRRERPGRRRGPGRSPGGWTGRSPAAT